jgi:hypothetical protein
MCFAACNNGRVSARLAIPASVVVAFSAIAFFGEHMNSLIKIASVFIAATGSAFAAGGLAVPEPGSLALVAVAVAGLVLVTRKK